MRILAGVLWMLVAGGAPAFAQPTWCWRLAGNFVSAAGSLVTDTQADKNGFYRIIGITGSANGAAVTALQPAGTAIPGNAGFPVDNLIRLAAPQLTKSGFGFATSDGAFHNPFYAGPYRDYISRPPDAEGKGAEPVIQFQATAAASAAACPAK